MNINPAGNLDGFLRRRASFQCTERDVAPRTRGEGIFLLFWIRAGTGIVPCALGINDKNAPIDSFVLRCLLRIGAGLDPCDQNADQAGRSCERVDRAVLHDDLLFVGLDARIIGANEAVACYSDAVGAYYSRDTASFFLNGVVSARSSDHPRRMRPHKEFLFNPSSVAHSLNV